MKITDLMIGDLVTCKDAPDYPASPILQIKGMVGAEDYDIYISENGSDVFDIYSIDDLKGIPLTPEILEKNGFESDTNMFGLCDYELFDDLILENRGDRFCISRRCKYSSSTYWVLTLHFVHQLQHVFRLYGIEKEIKL